MRAARRLDEDDAPPECSLAWPEEDNAEALLLQQWRSRPPERVGPPWLRRQGRAELTQTRLIAEIPHNPPVKHSARCRKYQCEVTFPRDYVLGWMAHGICPPPLLGSPDNPSSVQFGLALRDLWDLEGPPLDVSDEEGVEIQMRRCEAAIVAAIDMFHGHDPLVICSCREER